MSIDLPSSRLPTWDDVRGSDPAFTVSARGRALDWAVGVLRAELGERWLANAIEKFGELPLPLILAPMHLQAATETIELALLWAQGRELDRFAALRKDTRRNPSEEWVRHVLAQLELIALARCLGAEGTLEPRDNRAPADVAIDTGADRLVFEVSVLCPSRRTSAERERVDRDVDRLSMSARSAGVALAGEIGASPSETDLLSALDWIETWAPFVRLGGHARPFRAGALELSLHRQGDQFGPLRAATETEDLGPRMFEAVEKKLSQMRGSPATWLRLDALTGVWAFTRWGRRNLEDKTRELSDALQAADLATEGVDGLALCSGTAQFMGAVDERCFRDGPLVGLRQAIAPHRAREVLFVALSAEGQAQLPVIERLFAARGSWLEQALARAGLPSVAEISRL